jgi:hypothetical protein
MLTEAEADALDRAYTETLPPLGTGAGPLTRQREMLRALDEERADALAFLEAHCADSL